MTEKNEAEIPELEILITKEQIQERVAEIAQEIDRDYEDDPETELVLCGVLKGAIPFLADLLREIRHPNVMIDVIGVTSYGSETESSRDPKITMDVSIPPYGKNWIIVEDIVHTGYSMRKLLEMLSARGPKSLKVCTLLSKPEERDVDVPIDYLGFEIGKEWVEGNGLDTKERGRNRKNIVSIPLDN